MKEEPRKVEEYIINTRPHANSAICQESAMWQRLMLIAPRDLGARNTLRPRGASAASRDKSVLLLLLFYYSSYLASCLEDFVTTIETFNCAWKLIFPSSDCIVCNSCGHVNDEHRAGDLFVYVLLQQPVPSCRIWQHHLFAGSRQQSLEVKWRADWHVLLFVQRGLAL
jgi:hypothetical protein